MRKNATAIFILAGVFISASIALADVKLPAVFGDHMVLQQKENVAVWGWAAPGEKITVKGDWRKSKKSATASEDGTWSIKIRTPQAGKSGTLTITGNNEIVLNDILFGEVWICSGQSNMEWTMAQFASDKIKADIKTADHPQVRLFTVQRIFSESPKEDVVGTWQICSPETVSSFSAVGYYFGKNLHENLDVPIGLISTNWGGTKAEAWTSAETIQQFNQFDDVMSMIESPEKRNETFKMHQNQPTALYNAMIAPILNYRIAGAIWYQGESNCYDPIGYRTLFPAMINDWREKWDQSDFPFYYVQIAPFQYNPNTHSQAIREAQMMTLDAVVNVGMAVTMDIGEEKDIHPKNKYDVGNRLARWALAKTYGQKNIAWSGPIYKDMTIEDGKIRISFDFVDSGLAAKDGGLTDFEIAGADKQFMKAVATIENDTVVVFCDAVKDPVAVRYGWSNWVSGSLFNGAGLPASSFRTDDWPLQ